MGVKVVAPEGRCHVIRSRSRMKPPEGKSASSHLRVRFRSPYGQPTGYRNPPRTAPKTRLSVPPPGRSLSSWRTLTVYRPTSPHRVQFVVVSGEALAHYHRLQAPHKSMGVSLEIEGSDEPTAEGSACREQTLTSRSSSAGSKPVGISSETPFAIGGI